MKKVFYYIVFVFSFVATSVQQLHPAARRLLQRFPKVDQLTRSFSRLGVRLNRPVRHPQSQQTRKFLGINRAADQLPAAAKPGKKKFNTGPLVAGGLLAGVFAGRYYELCLQDQAPKQEFQKIIDIFDKEIFQKEVTENVAQLLSYENYMKIQKELVDPADLGIPVSSVTKDVCDFVASGRFDKYDWNAASQVKESLFSGHFAINRRPFFQEFSDDDFLNYFSLFDFSILAGLVRDSVKMKLDRGFIEIDNDSAFQGDVWSFRHIYLLRSRYIVQCYYGQFFCDSLILNRADKEFVMQKLINQKAIIALLQDDQTDDATKEICLALLLLCNESAFYYACLRFVKRVRQDYVREKEALSVDEKSREKS